jgi:Domain of unknown function (DUF4485)
MPENDDQRNKLMQWVHFLVNPFTSMATEHLAKRNRYLFMICTSLLTGNCLDFMKIVGSHHIKADKKKKPVRVAGVAQAQQPEPIASAQGIPVSILQALNPTTFEAIDSYPEWQREKCWDVRLQAILDAEKLALKDPKYRMLRQKDVKKCSIHADECPQDEVAKKIGRCLDNQFKYLLTLAESYQQVMQDEKEKINLWLQALSKVDKDACVDMKGIRNDYMMLMVGYLVNCEVKGPFEDLPTGCLQPMTQAIATYIAKRKTDPKDAQGKVPLNPVSDTVEAFMNSVPKIDEGAFALLSISGNLFASPR